MAQSYKDDKPYVGRWRPATCYPERGGCDCNVDDEVLFSARSQPEGFVWSEKAVSAHPEELPPSRIDDCSGFRDCTDLECCTDSRKRERQDLPPEGVVHLNNMVAAAGP